MHYSAGVLCDSTVGLTLNEVNVLIQVLQETNCSKVLPVSVDILCIPM